jgi:hypothetical protein
MRVDTYMYSYGSDGSMTIDCKVWHSIEEAYEYGKKRKDNQCFIVATTPEQIKRARQLMGWEVIEHDT